MYVRWKHGTKRIDPDYAGERPVHRAYLVECRRVAGKPRQKVIAYIGTFDEYPDNAPNRYYWWVDTREKLDTLGLTPKDRERVEQGLARVVPESTYEECRASQEEAIARIEEVRGGRFRL